jgi:DNA-binding LytR/AlgR family response regulator
MRESDKVNFIEFDSGEELLREIPFESDVLFVDIQMRGINGNEVVIELKRRMYQGIIVQCSGIFMPTPDTVKIAPFRYLLKQDTQEHTRREMFDIIDEMRLQKSCFVLESSYLREKVYIRTMDVVYITRHKKGSVLHLNVQRSEMYSDGKLIVAKPLEELEEQLQPIGFSCPHNSYLVNLKYVNMFPNKKEFIRAENHLIPISRSKEKVFMQEFIKYINRKYKEKLR